VSRGTWVPDEEGRSFRLQDCHLLWLPFPWYSTEITLADSSAPLCRGHVGSRDPADTTRTSLHVDGLGCSPFARRYLGNRGCFLFLQVLRWFTSLGSLPHPMDSGEDILAAPGWVSPFGNPRIKVC
jgi:hypothetical protein